MVLQNVLFSRRNTQKTCVSIVSKVNDYAVTRQLIVLVKSKKTNQKADTVVVDYVDMVSV